MALKDTKLHKFVMVQVAVLFFASITIQFIPDSWLNAYKNGLLVYVIFFAPFLIVWEIRCFKEIKESEKRIEARLKEFEQTRMKSGFENV